MYPTLELYLFILGVSHPQERNYTNMKQVNINTTGAGCDWIYLSLHATLKNKIDELGWVETCTRYDVLEDIIRIAKTMREVCVAREEAREA